MSRLTQKTKQRVMYLEQDSLEVVHTAQMVLMKHKRDGHYVVVDAAGTVWQASTSRTRSKE